MPGMEACADVMSENTPRPPVLERLLRIPDACCWFLDLLEERELLIPAQLCKRCLHNLPVGPCGCKRYATTDRIAAVGGAAEQMLSFSG